jgi:hypothetical protein
MEANLHKRVIGQDEGRGRGVPAIRRGLVGLKDPSARSAPSILPGPDRRGQDGALPARWRRPFSGTKTAIVPPWTCPNIWKNSRYRG